jgi:hypothetical protein
MRFRLALLCAALACTSACATAPVRLQRYRAAYSTHFEGVPDQAEACAVVRNRSAKPVEWVELRLRTQSHFGGDAVIRSRWVYRGTIAPGTAVALRFAHPPAADAIAVSHLRSGQGNAPESGRALVLAKECSDESLRAVIDGALRGRTAPDIELRTAERASPDAPDDALVAGP